MTSPAARRRALVRLAAAALIVVACLGNLRLAGVGDVLSIDALARHRALLAETVAARPLLAASAYLALYVLAVALSISGAVVLTLAGGFLFGVLAGTLLAAAAAATGAVLAFLLARRLAGPDALDRLGPQAARLAQALRQSAGAYLLAARLVPLFPFFLVNLVPAAVGMRLRTYALATFAGILPGTAVFSLAGAGLGGVFDAGSTLDVGTVLSPEILGALLGLAALSLATALLRRRLVARDLRAWTGLPTDDRAAGARSKTRATATCPIRSPETDRA